MCLKSLSVLITTFMLLFISCSIIPGVNNLTVTYNKLRSSSADLEPFLNLEKNYRIFLLTGIVGIYFELLHLQQFYHIVNLVHILIIRIAAFLSCQSSYFLRTSAYSLILIVLPFLLLLCFTISSYKLASFTLQ